MSNRPPLPPLRDVPQPATVTELYLAAILDELRQIRAPDKPQPSKDEIDLKEMRGKPVKEQTQSGK